MQDYLIKGQLFMNLMAYYPWLKTLHIAAMVCWFAGLFYLPRLFVYHSMTEDTPGRERFKIMERKLYRGIMNPSLVATWLFAALLLMAWPDLLKQGWLHAKITLVVILTAYHLWCGHLMRTFARDEKPHSHVFYRWINEIPVIFLLACIYLVVARPF